MLIEACEKHLKENPNDQTTMEEYVSIQNLCLARMR